MRSLGSTCHCPGRWILYTLWWSACSLFGQTPVCAWWTKCCEAVDIVKHRISTSSEGVLLIGFCSSSLRRFGVYLVFWWILFWLNLVAQAAQEYGGLWRFLSKYNRIASIYAFLYHLWHCGNLDEWIVSLLSWMIRTSEWIIHSLQGRSKFLHFLYRYHCIFSTIYSTIVTIWCFQGSSNQLLGI